VSEGDEEKENEELFIRGTLPPFLVANGSGRVG
jgi:hypothetical protein